MGFAKSSTHPAQQARQAASARGEAKPPGVDVAEEQSHVK